MNFNVPQFIETDDKIAFQLTAKQLGLFALGGVAMFIAYQFVEGGLFIFWAIVIAIITVGFVFFRPTGMSLGGFLLKGSKYLARPKVMVWQRKARKIQEIEKTPVKSDEKQHKINLFAKEKQMKNIGDLADILDKESDI